MTTITMTILNTRIVTCKRKKICVFSSLEPYGGGQVPTAHVDIKNVSLPRKFEWILLGGYHKLPARIGGAGVHTGAPTF